MARKKKTEKVEKPVVKTKVDNVNENDGVNEVCTLKHEKMYCTFPMYMKGLWQRLQRRFGKFEHVVNKAGTYNCYEYRLGFERFSMGIVFDDRSDDVYLFMHDYEWRRWLQLKRSGRRVFEFVKRENTHDYCSIN